MKENKTFFLLPVMLQCTWPNQCTKNIPQNYFGAIHLARTYLMANFSTPLPLYAPVHIFDDLLPFPKLCTYVLDGLFLNQKTNNSIPILYSLKYKHLKKKSKFFKSHTCPKLLHLISVRLSHINNIIIVHFKDTINPYSCLLKNTNFSTKKNP